MPLPLLEESPGDAACARLNARCLGESDVGRVRDKLLDLAAAHPGRDFKLDVGRVEYAGSTALSLLVALHNSVKAAGGCLSLHDVSPALFELLDLTRLNTLFDVRRLEAEELAAAASA